MTREVLKGLFLKHLPPLFRDVIVERLDFPTALGY
jgi:hypothetical protein